MTSIIKLIRVPDFFTLANAACGIGSIMASISGKPLLASFLLIAGVVFDYLDGALARVLKTQHSFGAHLDSLADIISFGAAPAVLAYTSGLNSPLEICILVVFLLAGILRLARFAELKDKFIEKHFIGMPITVNGLIFPVLFGMENVFGFAIPRTIIVALYLLCAILMISNIKVLKLK